MRRPTGIAVDSFRNVIVAANGNDDDSSMPKILVFDAKLSLTGSFCHASMTVRFVWGEPHGFS